MTEAPVPDRPDIHEPTHPRVKGPWGFRRSAHRKKRGEGALRKAASTGVRNLSLAGAGLAFDGKDFAARLYRLQHEGKARSVASHAGVFFDLGRHIEPFRPPQLGSLFPCSPPASKGNDPSQRGIGWGGHSSSAGAARRRITTRSTSTRSNQRAFQEQEQQTFLRSTLVAPSGLSAPAAFKHMNWRSQQDSNLQPTE